MYRASSSRRQRRQRIIDEQVGKMSVSLDELSLTESLEDNVSLMQQLFADVDTVQVRRLENENDAALKYAILFSEGVVNKDTISEHVIKPLMLSQSVQPGDALIDNLIWKVLKVGDSVKTTRVKDIVEAVSYGDTVLFAEGSAEAATLNTKSFTIRSIEEPENERSLAGPREGFTESLMTNLSMIRRKVLTNELKMKMRVFGRRTQTKVCICYMDGIVNKQLIDELNRRLDGIDMDAILDANYFAEMMRDAKLPLFRTTGYTERPDVVIGKLMEGRIALFVDGTPVVLTMPYLFIENFQSSEDYYLNYLFTSFSRLLRILGFILTVMVPGLYVAVVAYHHELMPTQLMINIAVERASVPLPAALEAFLMLIVFDLLRETGVRMPGNIGQALSIVGALVIGQSAVEAKLVAAPMIIVVALTGICTLLVPKMAGPAIFIRFWLLLLGTMFGFYGVLLGIVAVTIHVINLRSFGVPMVTPVGTLRHQEIKDTWVRAPWWQMNLRPRLTSNRTRMKNGDTGS